MHTFLFGGKYESRKKNVGDFGVEIGQDMVDNIVKLPNKLKVGDLREQGLPYYGGRIRIEKERVYRF